MALPTLGPAPFEAIATPSTQPEPEPLASALPEPIALVPTEAPVTARRFLPSLPRKEAGGLALGAILALGAGLFVVWLTLAWGRRTSRRTKPAASRGSQLDEAASRVAGVASALPALRDALAATLRALDRSYVLATAPARRAHEAWSFAQDLSEQAAGLHERLLQAQMQPPPSETAQVRALGDRLTQLALDLALATSPEGRADKALEVANELRGLGIDLSQREATPSGGAAPWMPYLVELSASLQARCARLEGILATSEFEENLAAQLRSGRDALDRGIAQAELLADRVRSLEEALPLSGTRSA